MIERVLTNLLDNAIRHSPPGTGIQVRLGSAGHEVEVRVSDTGPGIPADLRAGLFPRASARGPNRTGGGGAGRGIVQGSLQLHRSEKSGRASGRERGGEYG